ncbi:methylated-DNA-[protein]-cysteine S-methyltransferase [Psychromicrobium silvestre]|uniref:Methylated-DNA--protein-cysteine methyltransferase n=1 Tax=Psychromicrobium silvestre TaxID=1645614 RepID=A0A7Y9LVF1_9MICC|nr:methylated-DNA--[protein]-cysteine S-methyltransferase [Psychromicrobium silvestre]NYE96340.1 methylated-DNA-[protein]-cysteine S-methyltransferase [Psychromicrobium silvestre]
MNAMYTVIDSPLGSLTLLASTEALTGIYFEKHRSRPAKAEWGAAETDHPIFIQAAHQLGEYFAGQRSSFELTTATHGSELQERVWELLKRLPYGQTTSYGELAAELGDRHLAQAVGAAVGANPLSIVIPCHRVVGKDGKMTGYAGGVDRKLFLLELEEPASRKAEKLF